MSTLNTRRSAIQHAADAIWPWSVEASRPTRNRRPTRPPVFLSENPAASAAGDPAETPSRHSPKPPIEPSNPAGYSGTVKQTHGMTVPVESILLL